MAKQLRYFVYGKHPDHGAFGFGPGDVVPDWAEAMVTNPDAWVEAEEVPVDEVAPPASLAGAPAADGESSVPPEAGPPPHAGKGSGIDAWRAYAESIGVDIDDGASRDEIIAAVEAK